MNEHDKARPVSGEIMAARAAREPVQPGAFSDAEYEIVGGAADRQPSQFAGQPTSMSGMDLLKNGGNAAAIGRTSNRGGPWFWTFGLALVAGAFWVSGGHALVRQAVLTIPAVSQPPLRIGEVKTRIEKHGGRDILFVDGRAENGGEGAVALPPIEISVVANDGNVTRYFLGTNDTRLEPGGRYVFSSRLQAPTNGIKSVSVTFQEAPR